MAIIRKSTTKKSKKPPSWITAEIELAVMRWFWTHKNTKEIVPNVSYGLNLHECDVLALSRARYATEVEIKTSLGDLKKDREKAHGHRSNKIKYLYFAMPTHMLQYQEFVPDLGLALSHCLCKKWGFYGTLGNSAVCYCWMVWVKGYRGRPEIGWFN